jgi:uncharacterized membrane protein SirB2
MKKKAPFEQPNENLKEKSTEKWYDIPNLADTLLFLIPPIGLYCVFKSKKIVPNAVKIVGGILVFSGIVWLIISNADRF